MGVIQTTPLPTVLCTCMFKPFILHFRVQTRTMVQRVYERSHMNQCLVERSRFSFTTQLETTTVLLWKMDRSLRLSSILNAKQIVTTTPNDGQMFYTTFTLMASG